MPILQAIAPLGYAGRSALTVDAPTLSHRTALSHGLAMAMAPTPAGVYDPVNHIKGSLQGNAVMRPGAKGVCAVLDGTGDYVQFTWRGPGAVGMGSGYGGASCAAWVKLNAYSASGAAVGGNVTSSAQRFALTSDAAARVWDTDVVISPAVNFDDGRWHHVAFSGSKTGRTAVYWDGALRGTGAALTVDMVNVDRFSVGGVGGAGIDWNGSIAHWAIWSRPITAAEVNLHMRMPTILYEVRRPWSVIDRWDNSNLVEYSLEVDWDNDGTFGNDAGGDLTSYMIRYKASLGRGGNPGPLTSPAQAAQLTVELNNPGGFWTQTPNGFVTNPGVAVRLRAVSPGYVTLFNGFLDSIQPHYLHGGTPTATLTAYGALGWLNEHAANIETGILTGTTTELAAASVLNAIGWSANRRRLQTGVQSFPYWWSTDESALSALRRLEIDEQGFLHEDRLGNIVMEGRNARRLPLNTSGDDLGYGSWNDASTDAVDPAPVDVQYHAIDLHGRRRELVNEARVSYSEHSVASLAVLWTMTEKASITAGATLTIIGRSNTGVAVTAWTTPVSTTDYTANAQADGGGADMTANVSIVTTKRAKEIELAITNTHGSNTLYLTLLQARGTALVAGDTITVKVSDTTEQDSYGLRPYGVTGSLVGTAADAATLAELILARNRRTTYRLFSLTMLASQSAAALKLILQKDISSVIHLTAAYDADFGWRHDMLIESIEYWGDRSTGKLLFARFGLSSMGRYWEQYP